MASLLMPTRKACGRYVYHDVCLSAPTVRTLNSTNRNLKFTISLTKCISSFFFLKRNSARRSYLYTIVAPRVTIRNRRRTDVSSFSSASRHRTSVTIPLWQVARVIADEIDFVFFARRFPTAITIVGTSCGHLPRPNLGSVFLFFKLAVASISIGNDRV